MMLYAAWFAVAAAIGAGLGAAFPRDEAWPHDRRLPIGLLIPVAAITTAFIELALWRIDITNGDNVAVAQRALRQLCLLSFGLGFCGLVDDLVAAAPASRFTRLLRNAGFFVTAAVAMNHTPFTPSGSDQVLATLLAVTGAHVGVGLDTAPGRAAKFVIPVGLAVGIAAGIEPVLAGPAAVLGGGAGLWWFAARRSARLGSVGSAPLGAALGAMAAFGFDGVGEIATLLGLVFAAVANETIGFGTIIERVPPLRVYDRLGTPRASSR